MELSEEERKLVRRLERLAREWPKGYMIASMGGTLCLFRQDDYLINQGLWDESLDAEKMLWGSCTIPNTGGDW